MNYICKDELQKKTKIVKQISNIFLAMKFLVPNPTVQDKRDPKLQWLLLPTIILLYKFQICLHFFLFSEHIPQKCYSQSGIQNYLKQLFPLYHHINFIKNCSFLLVLFHFQVNSFLFELISFLIFTSFRSQPCRKYILSQVPPASPLSPLCLTHPLLTAFLISF